MKKVLIHISFVLLTCIMSDALFAQEQCQSAEQKTHYSRVLGVYRGILPCADCSGLDTELTLMKLTHHEPVGHYILKETYIGKSPTRVQKGKWKIIRGSGQGPNAIVYMLNPDRPKDVRYFLKVDQQSILSLDANKNEIQSPFNLTLRKQEVGLANPASLNCIQHGGVLEIRKDKTGNEFGVCHLTDGRVCEEWALFRDRQCTLPKQ